MPAKEVSHVLEPGLCALKVCVSCVIFHVPLACGTIDSTFTTAATRSSGRKKVLHWMPWLVKTGYPIMPVAAETSGMPPSARRTPSFGIRTVLSSSKMTSAPMALVAVLIVVIGSP